MRRFSTPFITTLLATALGVGAHTAADSAVSRDGYRDVVIVNRMDQPLIFSVVKNRHAIQIRTSPPGRVEAGDSGKFSIRRQGESDTHYLNVEYFVGHTGSEQRVGIVFKGARGERSHCVKARPDGVIEDVRNCGSWEGTDQWIFTFSAP